MGKTKTWKAAKKRITRTKTNKLLKRRAGQSHFNTKERGKTVMGKRRRVTVPKEIKWMI